MTHLFQRLLLVLTLCLLNLPAWAEEQVSEIYETYGSAEKLVPVLQPLLGVNDRITAYHNKLLVKAPRDRQDKLLEMLQEIDRPLRNLLISVRYSNLTGRELDHTSTDVTYIHDNKGVRIQGQDQPNDRMVVYKGSSRDDKIQAQVVTKEQYSTRKEDVTQQIRVMEGQQGFLQVGEERPETRYVFLNPAYGVGATTEYRQVGNGVYVVPQIMRDRKVRLELFTTNQRRSPGNQERVQTTEAQSVLLVEPDVWTPFAGSSATVTTNSDSIGTSTRSLKQGSPGLELKVTILE